MKNTSVNAAQPKQMAECQQESPTDAQPSVVLLCLGKETSADPTAKTAAVQTSSDTIQECVILSLAGVCLKSTTTEQPNQFKSESRISAFFSIYVDHFT